MFISRTAAQAIVEEIGEEIQEHINLMDGKGVIIASTDSERIGQIHEGARRIITEKLPVLYVSEEMESKTTRRGINLPLTVRDEVVGVVGITGDREQVERYGNIVRRMTEIMVEDSISKDVKRYDRRMKYRFMEEWIAKSGTTYNRSFIERGRNLGIDVEQPYRAMALSFADYQQLSDTLEGQKLLDEMESSVRHVMEQKEFLYLCQPPRQICLVPVRGDEEMGKIALQLAQMIQKKYGRKLIVGFDSSKGNKFDIHRCCLEAKKAAAHALTCGKDRFYYDKLNIELFLDEVADATMQEYLNKLFANLSEEKQGEYMNLIECYFACEGSIGKMSEVMFMHKNTLQYKLKKMAEITGKDIRLPSYMPIFYMALIFYQKLHRDSERSVTV